MTTNNRHDTPYEVALIGAGPIGIELAVGLKRAGVPYIHFDAAQLGYTMGWWPRNTHFFSTTERLAISGVPIQNNHQGRITGEEYLAYLRSVVEQFDLAIQTYEPVTGLQRDETGFTVTTGPISGERSYLARNVVLAIGDMHWPKRLEIAGEDLSHVSHYFHDPHDYFRRRLLIVGGKNSAVEAALRCWRGGAQVTISYRRPTFDYNRVKHWLLPDLNAQIEAGTIGFLANTAPLRITPAYVELECLNDDGEPTGKTIRHATDAVLLATGFRGDQSLLEQTGVRFHGPNRVPEFDPATMETNVPGLYLAGTVAAGVQQRYTLFIENCHDHVAKIVTAVCGRSCGPLGDVAARTYDLRFEQFEAN
ncbi:MAG: NAD(P)-binding domain-containing protein [Oscillochloris sp.]|nr:NAD(P)-binding domain-containing protein [Oscillochloris sp.]